MRCSCRRRSPAQAGCSLLATGHGTALPAGTRSTVSSKHKKDQGASRGAVRQQPLTPCWLAGEVMVLSAGTPGTPHAPAGKAFTCPQPLPGEADLLLVKGHLVERGSATLPSSCVPEREGRQRSLT